jgi:hypothetical protein
MSNIIKRPGKLERKYNKINPFLWVWIFSFAYLFLPEGNTIRLVLNLAHNLASFIVIVLFAMCVLDIIDYHIRIERHEAQEDEDKNIPNKTDIYKPDPSDTPISPTPDEHTRAADRKNISNIRP